MVFYGVHDPTARGEADVENEHTPTIFENIKDAIGMLKTRKEARMRSFDVRQDAMDYSITGIAKVLKPLHMPEPLVSSSDQSDPQARTAASSPTSSNSPSILDKPVHRGPKSQELVVFRKMIEQGKLDEVTKAAWRNPRYLIGSGDTPSILKESTRYNALHVAALAKDALMCERLLDIIGDQKFILQLYGAKNAHHCHETSCILQDLYLNMPERGRNETPLHLAVKFGAAEVVEVLTSYPQCNQTPNSDGMYPIDIICARKDCGLTVFQQIRELLTGRFYVPVIRSADNSLPPTIGEPFSPKHPPNLICDPLSPVMEIQAFAGPMNQEQARVFRKRWKTPPRVHSNASSPNQSQQLSPLTPTFARCSPKRQPKTDTLAKPDRGFPSRQLFPGRANSDSPISDHAAIVASSPKTSKPQADLSATSGERQTDDLNASMFGEDSFAELDDSLIPIVDDEPEAKFAETPPKHKALTALYGSYRNPSLDDSSLNTSTESASASPMFKERHTKLIDSEKGLEMIGRELAREKQVKWREYWPFLDCFIDIRSADGLDRLEQCLRTNAERRQPESKESLGQLCAALDGLQVRVNVDDDAATDEARGPPVLVRHPSTGRFIAAPQTNVAAYSAYLCSEKSWQVYARRLIGTLTAATGNAEKLGHIKDSLLAELRRLTALVISYQDDARFQSVKFDTGHSRFGHLVAGYLMEQTAQQVDEIRLELQRIEATFDLDAPAACVTKSILWYLNNPNTLVQPGLGLCEEAARTLWTSETRCKCRWERVKTTVAQINRKRLSRRMDHEDWNGAAIELADAAPPAEPSVGHSSQPLNGWTTHRATPNSESDSSDEGEYLSADSDDDVYLTPPESLSPCGSPSRCESPIKYNNYVMGEEPSKTDSDVMNALNGMDVDKTTHPFLFDWWNQMQKFQAIERNMFPSMTPLSVNSKNRCRINTKMLLQIDQQAVDYADDADESYSEDRPSWTLLRRLQVDRMWRFCGKQLMWTARNKQPLTAECPPPTIVSPREYAKIK